MMYMATDIAGNQRKCSFKVAVKGNSTLHQDRFHRIPQNQ